MPSSTEVALVDPSLVAGSGIVAESNKSLFAGDNNYSRVFSVKGGSSNKRRNEEVIVLKDRTADLIKVGSIAQSSSQVCYSSAIGSSDNERDRAR